MSDQPDISVVISTYNRCELLPIALDSVLTQKGNKVYYEIIVVNNNSTDDIKGVVESYMSRRITNLRYVFKGKQELAHGRNAGISQARGSIIALTNDDVIAAPDWVCNLKQAFNEHPDVACVGARFSRVSNAIPAWLTRDHWVGVLALQDYGDRPIFIDVSTPVISLVGANLSFRREVFKRIDCLHRSFLSREIKAILNF